MYQHTEFEPEYKKLRKFWLQYVKKADNFWNGIYGRKGIPFDYLVSDLKYLMNLVPEDIACNQAQNYAIVEYRQDGSLVFNGDTYLLEKLSSVETCSKCHVRKIIDMGKNRIELCDCPIFNQG